MSYPYPDHSRLARDQELTGLLSGRDQIVAKNIVRTRIRIQFNLPAFYLSQWSDLSYEHLERAIEIVRDAIYKGEL